MYRNPSRLVETKALKSSVVKSVNGLLRKIPALFTRTSTVPKRAIAASTTLAAVSCLPISPFTRIRLGEADNDLLAFRDVATTLYPFDRNPRTSPAPIPPDAPVTIAVFLSGICRSFLRTALGHRALESLRGSPAQGRVADCVAAHESCYRIPMRESCSANDSHQRVRRPTALVGFSPLP